MNVGLDVHLQSSGSSSFEEMVEAAGIERLVAMRDYEVLAPRKGHTLHRGKLVRSGMSPPHPNWVMVEYYDTRKTFFVPPARILPWTGYAERVVGLAEDKARAVPPTAIAMSIWRCELWTEGFFSVLFFTLGFLEAECQHGQASGLGTPPQRILVDWTSDLILFHGGVRSDNAWNHFFEQPPPPGQSASLPAPTSAAEVQAAAAAGTLAIASRFGAPWFTKLGNFRGAEPEEGAKAGGGGRLDCATIREGRAAVQRWLVLKPPIRQRVATAAAQVFRTEGTRWLAVHVRQTDKLKLEKSEKWQLQPASVAAHAVATAAAMGCRGVFLASDDANFKASVGAELRRAGLEVGGLQSLLSSGGLPAHKDPELDRRRNAEDCLVEVLLMARCDALLCTWSNVSVAVRFWASSDVLPTFHLDEPPPASVPTAMAGPDQSPDPLGTRQREEASQVHEVPSQLQREESYRSSLSVRRRPLPRASWRDGGRARTHARTGIAYTRASPVGA
jgi:hypothetical protein